MIGVSCRSLFSYHGRHGVKGRCGILLTCNMQMHSSLCCEEGVAPPWRVRVACTAVHMASIRSNGTHTRGDRTKQRRQTKKGTLSVVEERLHYDLVDVSLFSGRRRRLTQPMLLLVFRMRVTNKLYSVICRAACTRPCTEHDGSYEVILAKRLG